VCEHPAVLSDAIGVFSSELAAAYADVPMPVAVEPTAEVDGEGHASEPAPELPTHPDARVALLVGLPALRHVAAVHRLAHALGAPVANTWGAKGIYPWDDPHHMGTCGLQRDDFTLLGLGDFDVVLAIGVDPAETRPPLPSTTRLVRITGDPGRIDVPGTPRPLVPAGDNELFRRMSAIAQPGYLDESFPRHPARAVIELKRSLGPATRVTAPPGEIGLWVARTFPTDRMGSVVVPAHDRPGIGTAIGLVSAARGTDTVTVARGPVDDETRALVELATRHELPLRLEVWDDVDWSRTADLIAAAGPVVAWTA